jgi:hypothetical protein
MSLQRVWFSRSLHADFLLEYQTVFLLRTPKEKREPLWSIDGEACYLQGITEDHEKISQKKSIMFYSKRMWRQNLIQWLIADDESRARCRLPFSFFFTGATAPIWALALLTHGAERFLRSCQLCSHSRTSQRFIEPEGSPLVPILSQIDPIPPIPSYLSKINFNIVHPPTSLVNINK